LCVTYLKNSLVDVLIQIMARPRDYLRVHQNKDGTWR